MMMVVLLKDILINNYFLFKIFLYICCYKLKKYKIMKTVKIKTIEKQIRDGKVECLSDLRVGFVFIRRHPSRKSEIVEVVK